MPTTEFTAASIAYRRIAVTAVLALFTIGAMLQAASPPVQRTPPPKPIEFSNPAPRNSSRTERDAAARTPAQVLYRYNLKTLLESASQRLSLDTLPPKFVLTQAQLGTELYAQLARYTGRSESDGRRGGNDGRRGGNDGRRGGNDGRRGGNDGRRGGNDGRRGGNDGQGDAKHRCDDAELQTFIDENYYRYRGFATNLSDVMRQQDYKNPALWMKTTVESAVANATRTIHASKKALFAALLDYKKNGNKLIYPVGTVFISETTRKNAESGVAEFIEAEVMTKRGDGEWDFFIYFTTLKLSVAALPESSIGTVPNSCVGCHYRTGGVQQEPFKSFPKTAKSVKFEKGHQKYFQGNAPSVAAGSELRNEKVFAFLRESAVRSERTMGSYASLFIAGLLRDKAANKLSVPDKFIVDKLTPLFPELFSKLP